MQASGDVLLAASCRHSTAAVFGLLPAANGGSRLCPYRLHSRVSRPLYPAIVSHAPQSRGCCGCELRRLPMTNVGRQPDGDTDTPARETGHPPRLSHDLTTPSAQTIVHIISTMAPKRTATPPPLHDLPTAKEKKYDRQLRLWGASGQQALEETHILLINNGSGVTGIEALKNLVLPGIGQFSILDPAVVTEADLGVNFFLEDESLGKFRAEETVRLLVELNPDVKGTAVKEVSRLILSETTLC